MIITTVSVLLFILLWCLLVPFLAFMLYVFFKLIPGIISAIFGITLFIWGLSWIFGTFL